MIYESSIYKSDLKKEVSRIRGLFRHGIIRSDKRLFETEKFLFTSAFLIRKLIENKKISDELESETFEVEYAPVKNTLNTKDYFGRWKVDENYDIEKLHKTKLKLYDLANLFIHSHIFMFYPKKTKSKDNAEKMEIMLNSDWKSDKLFFFNLALYLKLCDLVASDDIVFSVIGRGKKKGGIREILIKSRISRETSEFSGVVEKLSNS